MLKKMLIPVVLLSIAVVGASCSTESTEISDQDVEELVAALLEDSDEKTKDEPPLEDELSTPSLTRSQQNAINSAKSYLSFSGFSRQGLIDQLSSEYGEQFPLADSIFAVDSLDVDWRQEAVESAESYLEFSSFSCQGLIEQLSSEYGSQFTLEQARYAANAVGLC